MTLYRHNGSSPAALPFSAFADNGEGYTGLENADPAILTLLGIAAAPSLPPHDPATHTVTWDNEAEAWEVQPLPAVHLPTVDVVTLACIALTASDVTILRCVERGIAVPEAWADYRQALRDVVRLGEGPLPTRPDWP
ncbi:hypothetical protein [Brevundimonas sp. TWP2-3-4b1]|uniref:hypothetical protein n=1 Tax=Brevundimonas sp. TWP2-3-4b1 TaxID=2804580 RepID=UPI003CE94732